MTAPSSRATSAGFALKKKRRDAQAGPQAHSDDKLSGIWQTSAGARFLIDDAGRTVAVDLVSSDAIRVLTGKLLRHEPSGDPKSLTGTFDVVFAADAPKRYTIDVTMTVGDANHLRLRFDKWPQWNGRGELISRVMVTELWTRSDSIFGKPGEGKKSTPSFAAGPAREGPRFRGDPFVPLPSNSEP